MSTSGQTHEAESRSSLVVATTSLLTNHTDNKNRALPSICTNYVLWCLECRGIKALLWQVVVGWRINHEDGATQTRQERVRYLVLFVTYYKSSHQHPAALSAPTSTLAG